jgi:glycine/D-amino acid oxidase-like deaminating enzyme
VRNPCFARAVHRAVERRVRLREHEEVAQFLVSGDQVQGIRTPQGIIEDDRDIVHAGAWMAQLLVQLDRSPAVEKN